MLVYTVRAGDTFATIAAGHGIDMATLGAANGIPSPYIIRIGQELRIPSHGYARPRPAPAPATRPPSVVAPVTPPHVVRPAPPPTPYAPTRARELDAPRLAWPTDGALETPFGRPVSGLPNNGIDLVAYDGMTVRAAAAGTVVFAGNEPRRFGQLVIVDHGGGWVTAYAYLGKVTVKQGQKVARRDRIATIGRSGEAVRPTLHFELRRNNIPRDPALYLPVRL